MSVRRSVSVVAAQPRPRLLVAAIAAYSAAFVALLAATTFSTADDPTGRAVVSMLLGLLVLWVGLAGGLMYGYRDRLAAAARGLPIGWRATFVLFATALALAEEAVTVTMTNLAPAFGSELGAAYITASTSYLEVVLFHSVVVFVPMFAAWAWLLARYDYRPVEVFLLFGLVGTIAEATIDPVSALGGFWFFVYGLFVYLPAYAVPPRTAATRPTARQHVLAVGLPLAAGALVALPVVYVREALGIQLLTA